MLRWLIRCNVKKMNIIYSNYEEQTGGPSVITDYLLHKVHNQVRENWRFKIFLLSQKFLKQFVQIYYWTIESSKVVLKMGTKYVDFLSIF